MAASGQNSAEKQQRSDNDISSWVDTEGEDSAKQDIHTSDKGIYSGRSSGLPGKKRKSKKSSKTESSPNKSANTKTAIEKLSNKSANEKPGDIKTAIEKTDTVKQASSWSSLSGFNEQSSRRSIYKADKDLVNSKDIPQCGTEAVETIEPETIASDLTDLYTNRLADSSLYQDYKNKKQYGFILPNNTYFSGRESAKPVRPEQPATAQTDDYCGDILKAFWKFLGYK